MSSQPMKQQKQRIVYCNGSFVHESEAKISIFDRGFLFADSVYEVTAVVDGILIDNDCHFARLQRSLEAIHLPLPFTTSSTSSTADSSTTNTTEVALQKIEEIQKEIVKRNNLTEGVVYMQITRGNSGDRQLILSKYESRSLEPSLIMFSQIKKIHHANDCEIKSIRIATCPDLRWKRCDIKTTMILPQYLSKQSAIIIDKAHDQAADDAWLVDEEGFVTEGSSNNAFLVLPPSPDSTAKCKGILVTRPLEWTAAAGSIGTTSARTPSRILPGITRDAILQLANDMQFLEIQERPFTVREAQTVALEAFSTSSSTVIVPVVEIDGVRIGSGNEEASNNGNGNHNNDNVAGPITLELRRRYLAARRCSSKKIPATG